MGSKNPEKTIQIFKTLNIQFYVLDLNSYIFINILFPKICLISFSNYSLREKVKISQIV